MRAIEAFAIVFVFVLFVAYAHTLIILTPESGNHYTTSRAMAYLLLSSDSIPYTNTFPENVSKIIPDLVFAEVEGSRFYYSNSSNVSTIRAVWLGYNGTFNPREVVIGVKP